MKFEWDNSKALENLRKHGVSFHEAASIFGDPLAVSYPDPEHSIAEHRYLTFGQSSKARLLVVSHTDRGDRIRVVSTREMTRKERIDYEQT